ncbi:MAG: VOC family protein [Polyangiaceae bacterium]
MSIQSVTPYLILFGRAPQAIALYEKALGAKVEQLQRFGDVDGSCPEARRDLVMHAELKIGDAKLMLSDGDGPAALLPSGLVSIALMLDDPEETHRIYDALAASGEADHKLFAAPWGALFGVAIDAFGVRWMLNCPLKK